MMLIPETDAFFKNRIVLPERLAPFGFVAQEGGHVYTTLLPGGQFALRVVITESGEVLTAVTDALSGEEYTLHRVPGAKGAFIGSMREAYTQVLTAISLECFARDVFKSADARSVIRYVRDRYQDELEFLWARFPENAVFRRKDTQKWYAALLTVRREKLGLNGGGTIEILDFRSSPEDIAALVDGKRYFPGYHMNKRHWLTVCLDGSLPIEEICARVDVSFALAV